MKNLKTPKELYPLVKISLKMISGKTVERGIIELTGAYCVTLAEVLTQLTQLDFASQTNLEEIIEAQKAVVSEGLDEVKRVVSEKLTSKE